MGIVERFRNYQDDSGPSAGRCGRTLMLDGFNEAQPGELPRRCQQPSLTRFPDA